MSVSPGPGVENENSYVFAFNGDRLLAITEEEEYQIPKYSELEKMKLEAVHHHYLGTSDISRRS